MKTIAYYQLGGTVRSLLDSFQNSIGPIGNHLQTTLLQNEQQSPGIEILVYLCLLLLFWREKEVKYLLTKSYPVEAPASSVPY